MKKAFFTSSFLLFLSMMLHGQIEEKIIKERVVPGKILKDGKELDGYIKRTGSLAGDSKNYAAPWLFQDDVKFIPKDIFEKTEKIKGSLYEKYGPDDCEGYSYDTLTFESVKFSNMTNVGFGMLGQKLFMQVISRDKISMYHFFNSPPKVITGADTWEKYYLECAEPNLVYRIGKDGKLKIIEHLNIEKELADCPSVVEKHKNQGYQDENLKGRKGLFAAMGKLNDLDMVRVRAIEDYNQSCK